MAFCSKCGTRGGDSASFCGNCGAQLPASGADFPPPATTFQYVHQVPESPRVATARNKKPDITWDRFWADACGMVVAVGLLGHALHQTHGIAESIGYGLGGALFGVPIALIARLFGHRRTRFLTMVVWGIVSALALAGPFLTPSASKSDQQVAAAMRDLAATAHSQVDANSGPRAPAQASGTRLTLVQAIGELKASLVAFNASNNKIEREMGALGLDKSLDAENLVDPQRIQESRNAIERYRALRAQAERSYEDYVATGRNIGTRLPPTESAGYLQNFDASAREVQAARARYMSADDVMLRDISSILDIAMENVGATYPQSGKIMFEDQIQLMRFNEAQARLRRSAAAEVSATKDLKALQNRGLAGFDHAASVLAGQ